MVPLLILSVSIGMRANLDLIPAAYLPLFSLLPHALLIVSTYLCIQFNQFRSLLIAIMMAISFLAIQTTLQGQSSSVTEQNGYLLISTLIPLMIFMISWFPERGIVTLPGLLLFLCLCIPVAMGGYLYFNPALLSDIRQYFPVNEISFSMLSPIGMALYIMVLIQQLIRLWFFKQTFDAAASVLLITLMIHFSLFQLPYISPAFFIAVQLILIWSILKQSHNMAYKDELTGIPGRRALNEALKSPGRKYVIAMMDIDHFKKFNDKYGHDVGDDVLKVVARKMARVKGGGKAYRYGGEEFTVIFKGKDPAACIPHLEAVREEIAAYSLTIREKAKRPKSRKEGKKQRGRMPKSKSISVTISIGVANRTATLTTAEAVIKAADKMLYKAKNAGRNCLVSG